MHNLLDKVLNSFISVVVSSALAGLIALGVALWAQAGPVLTIGVALAAAGTLLIGGTALVLWYRSTRQTYVAYPYPGFSLRIIEKRIVYRVDDDGILHFSRILKVKALSDNVDRYVDKFVWTGGNSALPHPGVGVSEIRPLGTAGIWTFYDSSFSMNLRKGESLDIESIWPPLDIHSSRPFVSTASDEPTDKIIFELTVPAKFRKDDVVLLEDLRSIESIHPFHTIKDKRFNEKGELKWEFKPNHYRHYRVRWEWKWANAEAVKPMEIVTQEAAS